MSFLVSVINGKQPSGGNGGVSDADFAHLDVDFLSPGVVGAGDLAVSAQVTPDMTVKVASGVVYIPNPAGTMLYRATLSPGQNVTIASNSSGNPRKSAIVAKIDTTATPDENGDLVASLVEVQGAPAASPANPTDSDIQSAIGAANGFLRLANLQVDNAAASITNAKISDARIRVKWKLGSVALKYPDSDGSNGQALKTDGAGNLSFGSVAQAAPGVRLTKSAAQSIASGSWTAVTWDQETYDTDAMHEGVTNPSRITIKTAGVFLFTFGTDWAGNTTGERICAFAVNGAREFESSPQTNIVDGRAMMSLAFLRKLAVNDYVEVFVFQTSGGGLNLNAATTNEIVTQFAAQYVGAGS